MKLSRNGVYAALLVAVGVIFIVAHWFGAFSTPKATPLEPPREFLFNDEPLPANISAPVSKEFPTVSIVTMSRGQFWCARNVLMNACYQTYPQTSIELLIGESSFLPSPFIEADIKTLKCNITLRTFWFNISTKHMNLGGMRNFLCHKARGEYIVMMDNDDIYHPRYLERVVHEFRRNASIAILEAKPHVKAQQNADGTIVSFPGWNPDAGGHLTSLTKAITVLCDYLDTYVNEEYGMVFCAKKHGLGFGKMDMNGPESSQTLLIKVQSGLSITDQVWFSNRHQYARMRPSDWSTKLSLLVWYYEQIHEVQRPSGVPFMPRTGMPYPGESAETAAEAGIYRAPKDIRVTFWDEFHSAHPSFLSKESLNSYCEGYALMPGVILTSPTHHSKLTSDKACCDYCRGLTGLNGTVNVTCVAFHFNSVSGDCGAEIKAPPFPKAYFPARTWSPETVLSIRAAALISLDAAIAG